MQLIRTTLIMYNHSSVQKHNLQMVWVINKPNSNISYTDIFIKRVTPHVYYISSNIIIITRQSQEDLRQATCLPNKQIEFIVYRADSSSIYNAVKKYLLIPDFFTYLSHFI